MVPNKLLEYLAAGVPVLATDSRCHAGILTHEVNGWLVEPSVNAMAEAIADLLEQPAKRRALGEAATETAEGYSFERIAERVAATYDAV
jgi:glycosyltransferase involved in cell wall biosynthesis